MKFHAILLLTAGLSAATMLAACQKNGGGRATVKDGRSDKAKAGQRDAKLETLGFKCEGSIDVDGTTINVEDKIISWDQSAEKVESVIAKVNRNSENGTYIIYLSKSEGDKAPSLGIYANLPDGKQIGAHGTLDSEVKLTLNSTGSKKISAKILCAVVNDKASLRPIKVDKDKKAKVHCGGFTSIAEVARTPLKDSAVLVGNGESTSIPNLDLDLGKALPKVSLKTDLQMSADQKVRNVKMTLQSDDKKLTATAEVLNNLSVIMMVHSTSGDERATLNHSCVTTAKESVEGEAEVDLSEGTSANEADATTTTSTTRQEDLGGLFE